MERVVCVNHAKVPIVKIWDPELELACDMNVNNTLALDNTRMIKTYVEIDERVRPLAMIIKYWTRKRILNDAGTSMIESKYAVVGQSTKSFDSLGRNTQFLHLDLHDLELPTDSQSSSVALSSQTATPAPALSGWKAVCLR